MKNWDLWYSLSIFMILFYCGCSYKGSYYFRQIAVGCKQRRRFYMKRGNVYFETTKSYCGCSFKRKPSAYILKFERRACSKFKTVWKHLQLRESAALFQTSAQNQSKLLYSSTSKLFKGPNDLNQNSALEVESHIFACPIAWCDCELFSCTRHQAKTNFEMVLLVK